MPVYHSKYADVPAAEACGCALLPLRTTKRGPAELLAEGENDILDEVLYYYRANVLFKTFEIKSAADRTMIYMTLYAGLVLRECERLQTAAEASKKLQLVAIRNFAVPGEAGWMLGTLFPTPASREEAETFKAYFKQAREEMGERVIQKLYTESGRNKWWAMFAKRKFMGVEMRER